MSLGSKLVLKSTTTTSLNDRFSKLMKSRPDESSRSSVPVGGVRPGSEKNRRFAEELERRSSGIRGDRENRRRSPDLRRRPLVNRLGDTGQGGARGFAQAIKRAPVRPSRTGLSGRIGKRPQQDNFQANRALKRAQNMLRNTERELMSLKNTPLSPISRPRRGGGTGRGGTRGRGRGGNTRGGRGAPRGGGRGGRSKPVSADTLDSQLDSYMLKTKGGLDAQMDEYMSKTKGGLDKQMEEYMAAKSK